MNNGSDRQQIVKFYVEKSLTTLDDAKTLATSKAWNSCANRMYYASFYVVYAFLIKVIDVRAKTHSSIKNLFNLHIVKEGLIDKEAASFYQLIFDNRNEADYEDFGNLTEEEVLPLISQAEDFILTIKKLIL